MLQHREPPSKMCGRVVLGKNLGFAQRGPLNIKFATYEGAFYESAPVWGQPSSLSFEDRGQQSHPKPMALKVTKDSVCL